MPDEVLVDTVDDSVLVITINRPQVRNAVDEAVAVGIAEALSRLDSDDTLSVGIITGAEGSGRPRRHFGLRRETAAEVDGVLSRTLLLGYPVARVSGVLS
ncbi:hypothetical protein BH683_004065 [Williamsia sp. 1138]|nr:hypothetical protein BH683_004065 [Williamsia sp. 1138]